MLCATSVRCALSSRRDKAVRRAVKRTKAVRSAAERDLYAMRCSALVATSAMRCAASYDECGAATVGWRDKI